jgi:hypothetical protein
VRVRSWQGDLHPLSLTFGQLRVVPVALLICLCTASVASAAPPPGADPERADSDLVPLAGIARYRHPVLLRG